MSDIPTASCFNDNGGIPTATCFNNKGVTFDDDGQMILPTMSTSVPYILDVATVLCILFALSFMPIAYYLGNRFIPATHKQFRILFYWHAYDALTHLFIEGSFLFECFFSYMKIPGGIGGAPHFLGRNDRVYGAAFGTWPSARLWQEYAKADFRWATADANVISLELLTVLLAGPAAAYICYMLWMIFNARISVEAKGDVRARLWFVATAVATAELYGGWMTFAPEWLTGSTKLETGNVVYLWFYLFFFNTLWVGMPLWVLREAWKEFREVFVLAERAGRNRKKA